MDMAQGGRSQISRNYLLFLLMFAVSGRMAFAETPDQRMVSGLLKPLADRQLFSGSVIVVQNGHTIAEQNTGLANRELNVPITAATRFYVASVTKSFTATAILMLRDAGALSLDDPVSKFIRDFPHGDITIRQLLMHTSGLQHPVFYPDYYDLAKRSYTTAAAVEVFKDRPVIGTPGNQRRYSDYNYTILARIIEVASGKSYSDFLSERIFRPQHLSTAGNQTGWSEIIPNRASGYQPVGMESFENAKFFDYSIATGAASLYMSAEDLARWIDALGGGVVLGLQSTHELLGSTNDDGILHGRDVAGRRAIALSGWDNVGFAADALYFTDAHLAVAVTANENDSGIASYLSEAIAQSILMGKPVEPLQFLPPRKDLQGFAGKYRFGSDFYVPGREIEIVTREGQLFEQQRDPDRLMGLIPVADGSFVYRSHWSRVTFQQEGGRVTALTFDGFKAVKTP